jgi:phosphoenolpyruvate-protein kinase (PTS system EI component)
MTQPAMLHAAVVELRGDILIHKPIIARELFIPCVNGVRDAAQQVRDGDLVTLDVHLDIATVGPSGFDLELQTRRRTGGALYERGNHRIMTCVFEASVALPA